MGGDGEVDGDKVVLTHGVAPPTPTNLTFEIQITGFKL